MIELILFAPLFGSLFAALFAFSKKNTLAAIVPIFALCAALIMGFWALFVVYEGNVVALTLAPWIAAGRANMEFGFVIDNVSIVMILVVLVVSLCVHIYSIGYMAHDACFNKFFAFLSAFVFSMLILVMSDNFLGLFIGWEGVGLCSWMLIGFWHNRQSASFAANEAFIMNRVADLGMLLGIFMIFYTFGSVRYSVVFENVSSVGALTLSIIGILLFIGAMGKSAQFPLHTWLADAMEGPTPVSALIHAATMVTAGVYLVIRAHPIYDAIPHIGLFIAYLGSFVAIFAASMALVNRDLKRIVAYSTLSQLGYMFVAAGLGYYAIALFHLTTHAFFKSLLFLGAGNVMHAMNDRLDISKMGALWQPLKYTAILMIIASVALAGIYPFAGFFSKDKILESAFLEGNFGIYAVLLISAFLTAFYSFRLIMLVFFAPKHYEVESAHDSHGDSSDSHGGAPHEAAKVMLYAMLPLGILAVIAGFMEHSFMEFLKNALSFKDKHLDSATFWILIAVALCVALSGIALAVFMYRKQSGIYKCDEAKLRENPLYRLLINQYFIPKIYDFCFVRSYKIISKFLWREIDLRIIDFVVDFIARVFVKGGERARVIQSGVLTHSLIFMVCGIFAMLAVLLVVF